MRDYYLELDAAAQKGTPKIAWCTRSAGEICALRFPGLFSGDAFGDAGATRMATEFIPEANAIGYSPRSAPISPPTSEPS